MAISLQSIMEITPLQAKAVKESCVKFLGKFWILYNKILRKATRPVRMQSLSSFILYMEKVEKLARDTVSEERNQSRKDLYKSVKVSTQEKERKLLEGGGTKTPPGYVACARCHYPYIDQPSINKEFERKNKLALEQYKNEMEKWNDYESGIGEAPMHKDGKQMKQKPGAPRVKQSLLRCHCHQMQRSVYNGAHSCPINCSDKDGKKYSRCPICECTCGFVWRISDHYSIVAQSKVDSNKGTSNYLQRWDETNRWFEESTMAGYHAAGYARDSLIEGT